MRFDGEMGQSFMTKRGGKKIAPFFFPEIAVVCVSKFNPN